MRAPGSWSARARLSRRHPGLPGWSARRRNRAGAGRATRTEPFAEERLRRPPGQRKPALVRPAREAGPRQVTGVVRLADQAHFDVRRDADRNHVSLARLIDV